MSLLSVVLPVYNGEKYLNRSIESVLGQTSQEYELIVVDDGSTDSSGDIADSYEKDYACVKVIHKPNEGVTVARLEGIKAATGDYVAFIDSDDWWDKDYIDCYMSKIKDGEVDFLAGGCIVERDTGTDLKLNNIPDGLYNLQNDGGYFYSKMLHYDGFFKFGILPYLWNKLFKRKILIDVYGDIDPLITDGEDVALIQPYLAKSRNALVFSEAKYHYTVHPMQKTANKGDDFYENASRLYICLKRSMQQHSCFKTFLPQLDQYMRYMIWMKTPDCFPKPGGVYQMPFQKIPLNSRIVLHGAGNVGKSYYRQIQNTHFCEMVSWVDQNYKEKNSRGMEMVEGIDSLWDKEFDYILIAIADTSIVEKVRQSYIEKGIEAERIVY